MLIRSQDRKSNTDDMNLYICESTNNNFSICNAKTGNLGEYSTEAKAIKVLDMISEYYFKKDQSFNMPQDEEVEA